MGRNLKILLITFAGILAYGAYYFAVPAFVNLPERVDTVEKILFEQTGMKFKISKPVLKMGYIPSANIKAEKLAILNNDDSYALSVEKPEINIRLLPLILKNIDINKFSAEKIDANLVYDGDFKLGQYELKEPPKSDFKLKHAALNINDYNLLLDDKTKSQKLFFDGQYLTVKNFTNNRHADISTILDISANKKKTSIKIDADIKLPLQNISDNHLRLDGHIANLDIADFSDYINKLSSGKVKSAKGTVNIVFDTIRADKHNKINTYAVIKDLGIFHEDNKLSITSDNKLEVKSEIKTINSGIDIQHLKVKGDDISLFVSGEITKLNSKIPNLNLKIGVPKSKAEKFVALLPPSHDLNPDMDFVVLKQAGFWGDASGYLEIKGKADYPNVQGNVLVENAYMVKQIPNSDKATIKLGFKGDKFDLDVKVPTSPTQTVWVKGPINIDKDKAADLHITSTDNVDLKTAQIVLNPLHEIFDFDLGPVPIMDIKGKGGIDLRVKGTKENPHAWGQFYFRDAVVSFLDIKNLEIVNGSGTLDFDNQNTLFVSKTAVLNGQPISIKGTCNLLGVLNFDVMSNKQNLKSLLHSVNTSPMLKDIRQMLLPIENIDGLANVKLNLKGQVKDVNDIVFNKNLFAKGTIEMLSDTIKLKDLPVQLSKVSGAINFDNMNADINLVSALNSSKIKIKAKLKDNICNAQISSDLFRFKDAAQLLTFKPPYEKDLAEIKSSFAAKYNGNIENIEYNKIDIKGKIYSNKNSQSAITLDDTTFELNNSNLKVPNLKGNFNGSPYNISINASKIFSKNPIINGYGKISSLDLRFLNDKNLQNILPKELRDIEILNGKLDVTSRAKNGNINVYTVFDDINLVYKPQDMKINLKSGNALLQNTTLNLNKINISADGMPVFVDGKVYNIYKKPNTNLYVNLKPNQEFFDKFINKKSIYPVKMKGDIIVASHLNGTFDNLQNKSEADIKENSSLYYMGALIGGGNNSVKIKSDSIYTPNKIKINNLQYDKIILSQNNKPFANTQLNAFGSLSFLPENIIGFNNFHIKTQNPTDAKIFNVIFGKPFMKQGVFTSDITLNGTSIYPKIIGNLNITSIDIPFFDSIIRDINFDFKPDKIFVLSKGTVLTNEVFLDAVMRNKLKPPYVIEDVKLKLADLNLNKIIDTINDIEAESARTISVSQQTEPFDIKQVIIRKGEITADKIQVRNINADNFNTVLKLTDKHVFNIDKFKFDIAEGIVDGNLDYNLNNSNISLDINLKNANSSIMSEALFDIKGQIYGLVDGGFKLSCNSDDCFKTLSGKGNFKIADGRMPKLGSLEYLLKAGNLIKGGITGLSVNGIIDLVTPLKTGNFESISGDIRIKDGIADDINIYSSGKDLNMYMTGSYNISTSVADMKIFGSISKSITSVFSKVKNASLNTLFNTIPGINDNKEKLLLQEEISKIPNIKNADIFKVFTVDVEGDINGNDYVRSFRWVK